MKVFTGNHLEDLVFSYTIILNFTGLFLNKNIIYHAAKLLLKKEQVLVILFFENMMI